MNPIVYEIFEKQMRSLVWIFIAMYVFLAITAGFGIFIGFQNVDLRYSTWVNSILAILSAVLLGLVLPIARRRLLDPKRVRNAAPEKLVSWGLPKNIEPTIGKQAAFLTRYSAGCVISWGLALSIGIYGLVSSIMGSSLIIVGLFFAAAAISLGIFPPKKKWVEEVMDEL
jgi:MFS family permease